MVTFDKGARVPRLEDGTRFDARQVGILLSKAVRPPIEPGGETYGVAWIDAGSAPPPRLAEMLERKGKHDPQVLLLALGMDALRRFEVQRGDGERFLLTGTRADGFVALQA